MSGFKSIQSIFVATHIRSIVPVLALLAAGCRAEGNPPTDAPIGDETGDHAGDGDDTPRPAAVFADADAADLRAAFAAATGISVMYATLAQSSAEFDSNVFEYEGGDGCPTREQVSRRPLVVRYSADDGCTTDLGITYAGTATATNPVLFDAEPDGGAMGGEYDGFVVDDGATRMELDGSWSQTASAIGVDSEATLDLTLLLNGQEWTVEGGWTADYVGDVAHTTCQDGTTGFVGGLGAFDVSCAMVGYGTAESSGWVELHGQDTLRIDLARDADRCYPITIDGVERAPLCPEVEEPTGEIDSDLFEAVTIEIENATTLLEAETRSGEVAHVALALAVDGGEVETHPLELAATEASDLWRATLTVDGTYEPGVTSAVPAGVPFYAVAFAYDADDALIGCQIQGYDEDPGPIDVSACPTR